MAAVLPTKGNLMATKRSRTLAMTGYELMDRKRNILIREMMALVETAQEIQGEIDQVFTEAYTALQVANIRLGVCDRIAEGVEIDDTLQIQYRSVMGVEIPHLASEIPPIKLEYGLVNTSSELDEAYHKFHKVKELIHKQAEVETTVYRLAQAIRKAQKRANALKNIVIPEFDRTIAIITDALEEKEREEFIRLKVIKAMATEE